ncbi:MAG: DNA gyrase subunit A [Candidatus Levyibacteriota bacterium]
MSLNIGRLQQTNITDEMKTSYLNYAMSVIVARALPDVRDGLKPVHRRILYAMNEMGLGPSAKFLKSARIVGETMGKYHPHGNMAIYDSLVRLAQDFSMRYPLVWGQGNFGSIDGDPPAADRYTEAKLQAISMELLTDLDKETVDFGPNYDGSFEEPLYLPAKLPNLLLMGAEGIAVGMATKIPPHNITEVIDAIVYTIGKTRTAADIAADATKSAVKDLANKELAANGEAPVVVTGAVQTPPLTTQSATNSILTCDVTIDELLEFVKGPDFPTAGSIYDINEIKSAYVTGRGKIVIRGKAEIEEIGNGKSAITITELPYQVNKALLIAKIADLAKEKKLDGISDLRDESDRRGLRIYVELKRDATPKKVLNNLFKQTSLQTTFPVNMVALVDGTPQTLNLKLILEEYLKHRYTVIKRRSEFELRQAKARLHILEGLKIAVDHIDAVIATIRGSKDQEDAKQNLIAKFALSEIQSVAILDMQLRRLAALERQKIEDELKAVQGVIAYLEDLLSHGEKILNVIKEELLKLKEKYADPRRTKVYKSKVGEFSEEDLIPNEPTVITLTNTGYIKRQSLTSFHTQHRGGKGITGMNLKDEDGIFHIRSAQTHDNIIFFTNKGKAYALKAYEISESSRTSKGSAIVNLLNIEAGEKVESFIVYGKSVKESYVFLTTRKGTVKKTHSNEFDNIRRNGMIAIKLDPGDELVWSNITDGKSNVLIITKGGKAIKFNEDSVRPLGRATMGVRGIKIDDKDQVIGMDVISKGDNPDVIAIMENGLGKKTPVNQFPLQNRGGQGVKVAKVTERTGQVVVAQVIPPSSEDVIITSKKGQIVKLSLSSIPKLSRDTQGVILMRFSHAKDGVASATCIEEPSIDLLPAVKETK